MTATDSQKAYILSLVQQLTGRQFGVLNQAAPVLGLTSTQINKLGKQTASALIDDLKAQVAAK